MAAICTRPLFYALLYSDDFNKVPALDPEKLKIFNTVREITGGCKCACVCACERVCVRACVNF